MSSHGFFATSYRNARADDRAALDQLLGDFSNQVQNYVRRNASLQRYQDIDADDVVQETMAAAVSAFDTCHVDNPLSFRNWLFAIAENKIREMVRFRTRKKRKSAGGKNTPIEDSHDAPANFRERSPSSYGAYNEAVQQIEHKIADMPTDYGRVLDLHYLQQKEIAEVANEMDRSQGAVRGLLYRASKRLRDALGPASKWLNQK